MQPEILIAADWGKTPRNRAVYKATVSQRSIECISRQASTLRHLLQIADREREKGPVLISLDLVRGCSRYLSYRSWRNRSVWCIPPRSPSTSGTFTKPFQGCVFSAANSHRGSALQPLAIRSSKPSRPNRS